VQIEIERIGPEKAAKYLEKNENRTLSQKGLKRLVVEMENGTWKQNGDPIRFSNGALVDGQHRLTAIISADYTGNFVVIRDIEKEALPTIDVGRRRSAADAVYMSNHKSMGPRMCNYLAKAASWEIKYLQKSLFMSSLATNEEILKKIEEEPELIECVEYMHKFPSKQRPVANLGLSSFLFFHFRQSNVGRAISFFDGLYSGANLSVGSPVLIVRNIFIEDKNRTGKKTWGLQGGMKATMLIVAWNSYIFGDSINSSRSFHNKVRKAKNGFIEIV